MNTVFLVDLNTKCYNVTQLLNQYTIFKRKSREKLMRIQLQFDIVLKKESQ